jgi:CheY-like chemotaxis protein
VSDTASTPNGESIRILLVDDEPNLLRVIARGLMRFGFEVTTADNPTLAIEQLRKEADKFDVFITDYGMPDMDGIMAAQLARKIHADMPILLLSGFLDSQRTNDAMKAGVTRVLFKPILTKRLAELILEVHQSG